MEKRIISFDMIGTTLYAIAENYAVYRTNLVNNRPETMRWEKCSTDSLPNNNEMLSNETILKANDKGVYVSSYLSKQKIATLNTMLFPRYDFQTVIIPGNGYASNVLGVLDNNDIFVVSNKKVANGSTLFPGIVLPQYNGVSSDWIETALVNVKSTSLSAIGYNATVIGFNDDEEGEGLAITTRSKYLLKKDGDWAFYNYKKYSNILPEKIEKIIFNKNTSKVFLIHQTGVSYGKITIGNNINVEWYTALKPFTKFNADAIDYYFSGNDLIFLTTMTSNEKEGIINGYVVEAAFEDSNSKSNYIRLNYSRKNEYASKSKTPFCRSKLANTGTIDPNNVYTIFLNDQGALSLSTDFSASWKRVDGPRI